MTELKITLLHLFRHFSLRLGPGQEQMALAHNLTLRPAHGLRVTVHPRSTRL